MSNTPDKDFITLCHKCEENLASLTLHSCPFREEIYDDTLLCECCEDCEHNCEIMRSPC